MKSPLLQMMAELTDVSDILANFYGIATVGDVAKLRMHLNRVQDAFAGKTNEQILVELNRDPSPEEQPKNYLTTDMGPDVTLYNPDVLVVDHRIEWLDDKGQVEQGISNFTRASNLAVGPCHALDFSGPVNARLTAAAVPDLSKCSTMIIKS